MVSIGTICYLGSHGAELLQSGWTKAVLDPALRDWTERIRAFARTEDSTELRARASGSRTRGDHRVSLAGLARRGARQGPHRGRRRPRAGGRPAVHWGRKVMEVRPPVRIDKGLAVTGLIRRSSVRAAVYVGDDATDLDAFRALTKLTESGELQYALRVGVRSEDGPADLQAATDLLVDGTEGVQQLLASLAAELPA